MVGIILHAIKLRRPKKLLNSTTTLSCLLAAPGLLHMARLMVKCFRHHTSGRTSTSDSRYHFRTVPCKCFLYSMYVACTCTAFHEPTCSCCSISGNYIRKTSTSDCRYHFRTVPCKVFLYSMYVARTVMYCMHPICTCMNVAAVVDTWTKAIQLLCFVYQNKIMRRIFLLSSVYFMIT